MSKRSLFWGQASGKLGEAVYYRAGGEQRTRTWVPKIKNPKSYTQAVQRTKMINMTAVFRGLKVAVNSFMKPASAAQSPFNAFTKANFPINAWVASKEDVTNQEGQAAFFQIANGSIGFDTTLSALSCKSLRDPEGESNYFLALTVPAFNVHFNRATPSGLLGLYTGAEFYQALVPAGNPNNLPAEFDVTVVVGVDGAANTQYYTFTVHAMANGTDTLHVAQQPVQSVPLTTEQLQKIVIIGDGEFTTMDEGQTGDATGSTIIGISSLGDNGAATANAVDTLAAIVISYKDASGKQSTSSRVHQGLGQAEYANQYTPTGALGADIVKSYETSSSLIGG